MTWFKDKILPSLITALLIGIFGAIWKIYIVVAGFPDQFDNVKNQNDRQDELLEQEINKWVEMEKEILILKTKLEK